MKKSKKKTVKNKSVNYFVSNSRLTRYQRKYCHCLMKARHEKNHYGKCINLFHKKIDRTKTNCFMNYDLEKYKLQEVKLLCKERKVKLYYMKNKKKKYYTKKGLINKLLENKFSKKKSKKK